MPTRIAAFMTHPIQYFSPLWQELARRDDVRLKVFYYSRRSAEAVHDAHFGVDVAWDIDLLGGYEHEFLPRQWPTKDPMDTGWKALNSGITHALDSEPWDAVLSQGYTHLNNWQLARGCRRRRIPFFIFADSNALAETGKGKLKLFAKRHVVSRFVRMCSGFFIFGEHGRDYFRKYGARPDQLHLTPIVVDVKRFQQRVSDMDAESVRSRYQIPHGKRLVAFCGKLRDIKRPVDLLAAVRRLNREDTMAILIGDGPLRADVEQQCGEHGLITGFVNQFDIPAVLSLAEVLVLPSSHEQFGFVTVEAAALGIPSIVSDRCGCWGKSGPVRDGQTGYVYPCGDVAALADRIGRILDDSGLKQRLGAAAFEASRYAWPENVADTMLAAVQESGDGQSTEPTGVPVGKRETIA